MTVLLALLEEDATCISDTVLPIQETETGNTTADVFTMGHTQCGF
jgi:hypothetical protein